MSHEEQRIDQSGSNISPDRVIGIAGPIHLSAFRDDLHQVEEADRAGVTGMGGTAVNILARGLLDRGQRVAFFSFDPHATKPLQLTGPGLSIVMLPYRSSNGARTLDGFRAERQLLRQAIRQEKPAIVHAHWTYEYALGALASGIPTLITVRDWSPLILRYNQGDLKTFIYRFRRHRMNQKTFRSAAYLSANSDVIRQRILDTWGRDVPVIPNPVDPVFFRETGKSWPGPHLIAISNGFRAQKNQKKLIRAFASLREKIAEATLSMLGDDFQPGGAAEKWAIAEGLEQGIRFVGSVGRKAMMDELDQAALLVHPSPEESFGNVLIEAMARRVPVLAGQDAGAVPWVLDKGAAGALCDVQDENDIQDKAFEILSSRDRWLELSGAGFARARDTFSLSHVVELCLAEYQRILRVEADKNRASS